MGVQSRFQSVPGGQQGRNSSSYSHHISEQREMNVVMLPGCCSCFLHPPAFQSPAHEMVLPTFRVGLPTFKTIPTDVPTAQPVLAQPLPQLRIPAQTTLEATFKTNQHRVLKADTQEGVPPAPVSLTSDSAQVTPNLLRSSPSMGGQRTWDVFDERGVCHPWGQVQGVRKCLRNGCLCDS